MYRCGFDRIRNIFLKLKSTVYPLVYYGRLTVLLGGPVKAGEPQTIVQYTGS